MNLTKSHTKQSRFQKRKLLPYLLVSPYLLFVIVFVLFPVFFCFYLTFHKWNIIAPMKFIGADNYSRLIHDRLFWKAIGNTLKFLLLHIPLQLVVSLFLAYLLNQKIRASSFFRVIKTLFVKVFTVTRVVNPGLFTGKEMELSFLEIKSISPVMFNFLMTALAVSRSVVSWGILSSFVCISANCLIVLNRFINSG